MRWGKLNMTHQGRAQRVELDGGSIFCSLLPHSFIPPLLPGVAWPGLRPHGATPYAIGIYLIILVRRASAFIGINVQSAPMRLYHLKGNTSGEFG